LYNVNNKPSTKGLALNFCTDRQGHVTDCELLEILGLGAEDYEGVYDANAGEKFLQDMLMGNVSVDESSAESFDGGQDEDKHDIKGGHVSWKERPKRGVCYDSAMQYAFDCNLVEVLDDGLLLIEDLRAGGVFAAQPQSGFTTRHRSIKPHLEPVRTPDVMKGSLFDPTEDFRTNRYMNLEGI